MIGTLTGLQWMIYDSFKIFMGLPSDALRADDLGDAVEGALRERRHGRLHAHLDGLERAQPDVREELRARGAREVDPRLVLRRALRARQVAVVLLEELVAAVLQRALDAVAEEGRRAARVDPAVPVGRDDLAPPVHVAFVELAVDLAPAFDEVEGGYGPVR